MALFNSLLLAILGASHKELARQVRYLVVENQILRSKLPARITITAKERQRLVKFGVKLGKAIPQLVTIVTPGTFLRLGSRSQTSRSKRHQTGQTREATNS